MSMLQSDRVNRHVRKQIEHKLISIVTRAELAPRRNYLLGEEEEVKNRTKGRRAKSLSSLLGS